MRNQAVSRAELLERLAGPGGDFALFNDAETAVILDVRPPTLSQWRWRGCGPSFVKLGGRNVRYTGRTLKEYLAGNVYSSTTEQQAA